MSACEIKAQAAKTAEKTEREDTALVIHLGVFFDGSSRDTFKSAILSSLYSPPQDDTHKKLTMSVSPGVRVKIEQQFDPEGIEKFGETLGEELYSIFKRLRQLLSPYLENAGSLSVEIDTFCVEDGFFTASLFCEIIEPNCFDKKPMYAQIAMADLAGGTVFDDIRMRGGNIIMNSFTTFQLPPNEEGLVKSTSGETPQKQDKKGEAETVVKNEGNGNTDYIYQEQSKSNYEYIRRKDGNGETLFFDIKIQGAKYEGLYSNLCTAKEWLENAALACDIVALSTSLSGIGLPAGAVAEVLSMGASGLSAVVCFTLAGMDAINKDEESKREHIADAGWDAVGAIPFGSLLAKTGKGAKFSTNVKSVNVKSIISADTIVGTPGLTNKVTKLHPDQPYLKVIDGGNQGSANAVREATSRSNFSVIQGGKQEQKVLKQVGGADILVSDTSINSHLTVVNSIDGFRPINYFSIPISSQVSINAGSHITGHTAHRLSKNDSIFQEYIEDAIENNENVKNAVIAYQGMLKWEWYERFVHYLIELKKKK